MTRRKFFSQLRRIFEDSQEAVIQYLTQEIKFLHGPFSPQAQT